MFTALRAAWSRLSRRIRITAVVSVAIMLGGIAVVTAAQKADTRLLTPHSIDVTVTPVPFDTAQPTRRDFGRLILRGGVSLRSPSPYFGGYSGLMLDAKGHRLLAISDSGSWLSARIDYSGEQPVGLSDARIGPITQKDGRPIQDQRFTDAEGIDAVSPRGDINGRYLISFEGKHRIDEYVFADGVLSGPIDNRTLPGNMRRMRRNAGLEAIAILRGGPHAGALVTLAERLLTKQGDHTGAIVIDGKASPLTIARADTFDITGARSLKDGSLLLLERSFNPMTFRLDIRLRLIPAAEIKPGAKLVGVELMRAGPDKQIDNFEGIAVSEGERGETIITLISDDNFNFVQRTLLVQFELK